MRSCSCVVSAWLGLEKRFCLIRTSLTRRAGTGLTVAPNPYMLRTDHSSIYLPAKKNTFAIFKQVYGMFYHSKRTTTNILIDNKQQHVRGACGVWAYADKNEQQVLVGMSC